MKIGSNRGINKDRKKMPITPPNVTPKKIVIPAIQHNPVGATRPQSLKMLTEMHNNEKLAIKLLILGTGLIAYHFL